ncbi:hypothetical protein [Photobacterium lipolyticum]|uniref:Uncharacterized protein n=1 Tax=Photobacterium lipolyticum TaxID=266810 RepID=A0A2T3N2R2_9GAMM|nr:hypothetical protein [Photobacterium lipolyticum]PSW06662.1 hypothetical protein C9I89_03770 [Photobacterium lipolyticum]
MRNLIAGFIALVVGLFTVSFAAIMGLFIAVAALLTRPLIKKRVAYAQAGYSQAGYSQARDSQKGYAKANMPDRHTVIDGECEDITASRKF